MDTENKPSLSNLTPEELEKRIDRLASEMKTEGGEYEIAPTPEREPFFVRLWHWLLPKQ